MEYGCHFTIFGLKMTVKSSVGKIFLKLFHVQAIFKLFLLHKKDNFWYKIINSVTKITFLAHGGISKKKKISAVYVDMMSETLSPKFHPYSIMTTQTMVESESYF